MKWETWEKERRDIEDEENMWRRQREDQLMEQQRRREEQNLPHPPPGKAPVSVLRPHSGTARRIRGRAHIEKISRDAEALGFTGSNSARALGARIPVDTRAPIIISDDNRHSKSSPGAFGAAIQAREMQTGGSGSVRRGDASKRQPSYSGIELALKRHSARRKVPPSEVARLLAEEKLSALTARQEPEPEPDAELAQQQKQEQEQEQELPPKSQLPVQPHPPQRGATDGTALLPTSTTAPLNRTGTPADVLTVSATGGSGLPSTGGLAVKASTAPAADGVYTGATSTRCHDPPPRPKGRGRVPRGVK